MGAETRCLRSKRLRALLWYAADGKCQLCGRELPDSWHADHVIPYSASGRTNVHEMQALCPACNLRKGGSRVILRQHQKELEAYLTEIQSGAKPRTIVMEATPGGGKSVVPIMLANALIPSGFADFVCWSVPRISLAEQAEEDFVDIVNIAFNPRKLKIRQSTNDYRPCRDTNGFVTTHMAIAADQLDTVLQQFNAARGINVIDECHHVYEGSPVHRKMEPIFRRASLNVLMSGNLSRGDGRQAAFIPYRNVTDKILAIDYEHPDYRFIRYTRSQALRERAKIPITFAHLDGAVSWYDREGNLCETDTLNVMDDEDSSVVYAAIQTEYAIQLLTACVEDFIPHRHLVNPRAKLLTVAYSIKEANRYIEYIKERWPQLRCGIAVCKDADGLDASKAARGAIKRFKKHQGNALDVLVTVQMAYEGLNAPSITHIACLTHIRSWPWIEQMLDRGTRVDYAKEAGPWEAQKLRAFVPDDYKMNEAIRKIEAEQAAYVQLGGPATAPPVLPGTGSAQAAGIDGGPNGIIPIDGIVTGTRFTGKIGDNPVEIKSEEGRRLAELMQRHGLCGSPMELMAAFQEWNTTRPNVEESRPAFRLGSLAPSEEENKLRSGIEGYCKSADRIYHGMQWGRTSAIVKAEFGKGRDDMEIIELRQVWAFLQKRFPIREAM